MEQSENGRTRSYLLSTLGHLPLRRNRQRLINLAGYLLSLSVFVHLKRWQSEIDQNSSYLPTPPAGAQLRRKHNYLLSPSACDVTLI